MADLGGVQNSEINLIFGDGIVEGRVGDIAGEPGNENIEDRVVH